MKKALSVFAILLFVSITTWAQAPNEFNYQGVARNSSGVPLASATISVRLSIIDGSPTSSIIYQDTHVGDVQTNVFGLFNVAIGSGTPSVGTFAGVSWGVGNKYMQVEIDPAGGSSFITITPAGNPPQLLSVPYALYAASAGNTYTAGTGILPITGGIIQTDSTIVPKWDDTLVGNLKLITPAKLASFGYGTGSVTSIATGYGLSGGPVTTTGTLVADTAELFPALVSTLAPGTGISISGRTIANIPSSNYLLAEEQEPSGTSGGTSIAGPQIRVLNTTIGSAGTAISRSGNIISLNETGTYYIKASAPCEDGNQHQLNITPATGGAPYISGQSSYARGGTFDVMTKAEVEGFITVTTTPTTFVLMHYIQNSIGGGLGGGASSGYPEVYSKVFVQKIQ